MKNADYPGYICLSFWIKRMRESKSSALSDKSAALWLRYVGSPLEESKFSITEGQRGKLRVCHAISKPSKAVAAAQRHDNRGLALTALRALSALV